MAQSPIVSAPILEGQVATQIGIQKTQTGIIGAMRAAIESMEKAEAKIQKVMQKAQWLREMKSMTKLLLMIEGTICTTKDLDMNLSYSGGSCFVEFNYNLSILKMTTAVDFVSLALTSSVLMTQSERLEIVDQAIDLFEEAQWTLAELNNQLKDLKNALRTDQEVKKAVPEFAKFSRY